jgi:2-desacetyl-2-hydroxyethyl bacteriochlorophyllide A dehydrogenase
MRAIICRAPGDLVFADRPTPAAPPPGWTELAVSHVGICGTDYHIFEGKHPFLIYPRIMGHEVSGHVAATGANVDRPIGQTVILNPYIACGRCIACRHGKPNCCTAIQVLGVHTDGAMCDRLLVPDTNLYPADGLSPRDAAMIEFLAIGAHAVRRSLAPAGTRSLVIGAGPIGLGTALFARIQGHSVTLLDASRERLDQAATLGFTSAIGLGPDTAADIAATTGGDGFDAVFDATGNAKSIQAAFAHVAHGGVLVLVSVVKDDITFADPEFHKREMMLIGSRNATKQDFDHVASSIRAGLVPLDTLATHATRLEDVPRDLAHWAHDKTGLIKAVIEVGGHR